jgi:tetratricopeptide (TPR) repeat protein
MKKILTIVTLCVYSFAQANPADSSNFYYLKGLEEKKAKRYQVASLQFDKSIAFNPNNTSALLENAYTNLEMRKTDQAKMLFSKVYQINPSNKQVIKELMNIYYNYRQFDKAVELAKKCVDCKESQRIIGMSSYHQEDYTTAEAYLKPYLDKNVNDAEVTYTLARTYIDMEETKKAIPYMERAVKLPDAKAVWMYEQAILLYEMNDYKNAVAAFSNAVEHGYTQSLDFNENYGFACLYSGDYEKGEKLIMSVWSKKTGNKDLLRGLAEVLFQQKQFDRSLFYCQKLIELDGKDGKALYQAGLCFQKKGEKDRGQAMCDKAIELDPSLESLRRKKDLSFL